MAFVNLQRFLSANKGEDERMGQMATEGASPDVNRATNAIARVGTDDKRDVFGDVARGQSRLNMLGSTGGTASLIGPGASALDAALAGQSKTLQDYRQRYGNLYDRLSGAETRAQGEERAQQYRRAASQRAWEERQAQAARDAAPDWRGYRSPDAEAVQRARVAGYTGNDAEGARRYWKAKFGEDL